MDRMMSVDETSRQLVNDDVEIELIGDDGIQSLRRPKRPHEMISIQDGNISQASSTFKSISTDASVTRQRVSPTSVIMDTPMADDGDGNANQIPSYVVPQLHNVDDTLRQQFFISWETDQETLRKYPDEAKAFAKNIKEQVHIIQTSGKVIANDMLTSTIEQLNRGKEESKITRKTNGVLMSVDKAHGNYLSTLIESQGQHSNSGQAQVHSVFSRFVCNRDLVCLLYTSPSPRD